MRTPLITLLAGAFALTLRARTATLTANKLLQIDGDWTAGSLPQIDPGDTTRLRWIAPGALGGGTVSTVNLAPSTSSIFSVVTPTTTPTISLQSQAANLFLASPDGAAGVPVLRAMVANDVPALPAGKITSGVFNIAQIPTGTTASTVALGNDSRFHAQNSDVGTSSSTFYLGGASGPKLKANAGAIEVRNNADSSWADLVVNNLFVRGTQTVIDSNQVNVGDSILTLNSDFSGTTPTENGGFEVQRGTQTNASMIWNETSDTFACGLLGAEKNISRSHLQSFTSANVTGGVLTVTHNLGQQYVHYMLYDNANNSMLAQAVATSANVLTVDLSDTTITGTWQIVVQS